MCMNVLPAVLIGFYEHPPVHALEYVGFGITILAYVWESIADF